MVNTDFRIEPEDIILLHVGGAVGSCDPLALVVNCFPRQCVVFTFEAREVEGDRITKKRYEASGVRTVLVNACIAETAGTSPFFINKHGDSSSMLPPSQQALDEHSPDFPAGVRTWRDNTELERVITLNTINLQEFIEQQGVSPDVLSIDAQGMELRIMKGAGSAMSLVNAVVSEVEFFEIYSGQGLFHEQMLLLDNYGFRLADLLNSQYWHPGPACGKGFLTVAEALWFRNIKSFLELNAAGDCFVMRGIKLAAVAFAFQRYSYSYTLLKELIKRDRALVEGLCYKHGFEILLKMADSVDRNLRYNAPGRPLRYFLARGARKVGRAVLGYLER